MDRNCNPFNPGAGVSPPELAGRSEVLDIAETALQRVKRRKHAKSLMILEPDAWKAIRDPVEDEGATISEAALGEIYNKTRGYPYFLQVWGYSAWNIAEGDTITEQDAFAATAESIRKLDESFFRVRFDRTTPAEREYMFRLAELGSESQRSSDVAVALGRTATSIGPLRDSLIKKGMIYSPEYGRVAFTVPLFDEFLRRV